MQQFRITLRNDKRKSYKASLVVLIILSLLSFLFLAYITKNSEVRDMSFYAAGCIAVSIILDVLIKNKKRVDFKSAAILFAILYYIRLQYYWMALAMIILSLLFSLAIRSLIVYVSEEISLSSFSRKVNGTV
jgi:hypothetical protein